MERLTQPRAGAVRVLCGAPDPQQTAALLTVLAAVLHPAAGGRACEPPRPVRPTWLPFTGHSRGGWGQP